MLGRFDRRAAALCRSSIEEGARARWRQYREIWAYVEEDALPPRGDPAPLRRPRGAGARRRGLLRRLRPGPGAGAPPPPDPVEIGDLDDAIVSVAARRAARPSGRTTCAEILHGARSKKIKRNSYDGLPAYGASSHMRRADILARVDELIEEGRLATTGGPYPVLRLAGGRRGVSFRVAVLVSGEGTNLQALLDRSTAGRHRGGRRRPPTSRRRAGSSAPRAAGVETGVFALADYAGPRRRATRALGDWLEERGVELVVLAGFMELLGPGFIRRFAGRIVNVHPRCCPPSPACGAIEQALEHGVKVMGVTVHFVDEGVDSGPIILQEAFELPYPRDIEEIEERVHEIEHRLLPRAVRLIAAGRVRIDPDNPRLVSWMAE